MNAQRKKIILAEINYWKQHKLLPEHYCDFLITLYSEGDHGQEISATTDSVLSIERKRFYLRYLIPIILAAGAGAFMFILPEYHVITIIATVITTIAMLLTAIFGKTMHAGFVSLLYILSAFLVLGISLKLWMLFFDGQIIMLVTVLLFNCLLWLLAGRLLKLLYFTISGVAGFLLIVVFIINAVI